ncbi:MAG: J domain-containing protein [Chloroflexi bacterium]|nr:J domain-containing protein [Chloroflexota bacterium]
MNYYTLLQVLPSATDKEIRHAYRKLVKIYHPDHLQQAALAQRLKGEEKLKLLNLAYGVLSNPVKRQQYDVALPRSKEPSGENAQRKRRAQQKRQTYQKQTKQRPYTHTTTQARQNLAQARSIYLQIKVELMDLKKEIANWLIEAALKALLLGLGVSGGTAVLMLLLSFILQLLHIQHNQWVALWGLLYAILIQIGAVFVLMHTIQIEIKPGKMVAAVFKVGRVVMFSLVLLIGFVGNPFQAGLAAGNTFLLMMALQIITCTLMAPEWLKPLLTQRRHLENRLATAQQMIDYYKDTMDTVTFN